MKIIVGCKLLAEEQDIAINENGTLDTSKASPKISQFDLNAIETALNIKQENENVTISALSVGGKYLKNTKVQKDILSRGADELVTIIDESHENLLPHQTAFILAKAAKKEGFDLIVCGDASGDLYAQQVGIRLGSILNIPSVNSVSKIQSINVQNIVVERTLEHEVEVLEVPLPAVICVSTDINIPSIPGMKAILGAGKKPIKNLSLEDIGIEDSLDLVDLIKIEAPKQKERLNIIIEGDDDEKIALFIDNLRKVIK